MKKCNECHSVNNSNAKYCRCCGVVLENILKLYPKMRLVPTNFYDWRKPKVGMLLKMFLMLPIILFSSRTLYSIFFFFFYDHGPEPGFTAPYVADLVLPHSAVAFHLDFV